MNPSRHRDASDRLPRNSRRTDSGHGREPSGLLEGRVTRAYGRQLVVEDVAGVPHPCRTFGKDLRVVCGDRVGFLPEAAGSGVGLVHAIRPRKGVLARWSMAGQPEVLAAHVTRLVVVFAPLPVPDFHVVDRYLAAAALGRFEAVVVCTKSDLLVPPARQAPADALSAALAEYRSLGYPTFLLDTRCAAGFAELAAQLAQGTSVLVGQSGVGKSSLLNRLVPAAAAAIGEVSDSTDEGRHTTTSASLHRLPGGGEVIDSPGVRDFSPPVPDPREARLGYVEVAALGSGCRFLDCLHREEPGCAVRLAVGEPPAAGLPPLSARRYASYRRLLNIALQMAERRPGGR